MSYEDILLERPSDSESEPALASVESIELHAQKQEDTMSAREADLLRTFDDIHPETAEQEQVLAALKERTLALSHSRLDLKVAAQTAALSVALEGLMSGQDSRSPEHETQAAQLIAKNPELAEMLMHRILAIPENLGHEGSYGEKRSALVTEAKEVLKGMDGSDSKIYKGVAFRTAERVTRALISASTLGIGAIVYDSAKDLYVSLRSRSELRIKQRLMTSAAIPT